MFDLGAAELLVIAIVAVIVIGPKDMPAALRVAGRWIGKVRSVSSHFRTGLDSMIREAELEDMEKKWKEQNEAIMAKAPALGASAESALHADDPAPDTDAGPGEEMTGPPASYDPSTDAPVDDTTVPKGGS
ncbi:MAG: Sec-independent protein translocase protein TatB [Marinomonas sp.]